MVLENQKRKVMTGYGIVSAFGSAMKHGKSFSP